MPYGPNRPETTPALNPDPQHHDTGASQSSVELGYTRPYRRPRAPGIDECMPAESADRMEEMFKTPPFFETMDDY